LQQVDEILIVDNRVSSYRFTLGDPFYKSPAWLGALTARRKFMKKPNLNLLLVVVVSLLMVGCTMVAKDAKLTGKGFKQLQANDYTAAEESFVEALNYNSDNPYAMLNLGVVYQNTNRSDEAIAMYEKVIKRDGPEMVEESTEDGHVGKTLVQLAKENLSKL